MAALALAALAALASTRGVAAQFNIISDHSFKGPYRSFHGEGHRTMEHWTAGGSTEVNEHFVRLTNDRQSRKGWLWSTRNWAWLDGWTITLRLRVSGQGKRLFGDGMAFWFTTQSDFKQGPAHGFTDTFKGFGIIFDTYVNTDPGHVHKDILVITNDGTASKLAPHGGTTDPHPIGCDADFRFWEGRGDFNVTKKTHVKITFRGNALSVSVDPKGAGEWKDCVRDVPVNAGSEDWWRTGSWVGLSASTGDLADNHDVLSLLTTADGGDVVVPEDNLHLAPPLASSGSVETDTAIRSSADREAFLLEERLSVLTHSIEHKLARVEDHIKATLKKFGDQEAALEKRLAKLEGVLEQRLKGELTQRLASVSSSLESSVKTRLASELLPSLASTHRTLYVGLGSVLLLLGGAGLLAWRQYKKLRKSHLL